MQGGRGGEQPGGPPPGRELPLWRRVGRAISRTVVPVTGPLRGNRDDPWLAEFEPPEDDEDLQGSREEPREPGTPTA